MSKTENPAGTEVNPLAFATLDDVSRMEEQLREAGHKDAKLALFRGRGKHYRLPLSEVHKQSRNKKKREAYKKAYDALVYEHIRIRRENPENFPDPEATDEESAQIEALEAKFAPEPELAANDPSFALEGDERVEWDKGIRADMEASLDDKPLSERRHFIVALKQCVPMLGVLDADKSTEFTRKLARTATEQGVWLARSTSKGFHLIVPRDCNWREVAVSRADTANFAPPRKQGAGRPPSKVGEILQGHATLYKVVGGSPLGLKDVPELHEMLSDRDAPPAHRIESVMIELLAEMQDWKTMGEGNGRGRRWFWLVHELARRLTDVGLHPNDPEWAECAQKLLARHDSVREPRMQLPDMLDYMREEAVQHRMPSMPELPTPGEVQVGFMKPGESYAPTESPETDAPAPPVETEPPQEARPAPADSSDAVADNEDSGALLLLSAKARLQAAFGGYIVPVPEKDNNRRETKFVVWNFERRQWDTYLYGCANMERDGRTHPDFRSLIERSIRETLRDKGKRQPDIDVMERYLNALYPGLVSGALGGSDVFKAFDYEPEFPPKDGTLRGEGVVYYSTGDGNVVRVSVHPDDIKAGTTVQCGIPNDPRYRTYASLTTPAKEESGRFLEVLNKNLQGEDGLIAEWFRWGIAETLLPRGYQEVEFIHALGSGRNGKSIILDAYDNALGDFSYKVPKFEAMAEVEGEARQQGRRRHFFGKRLVWVNEAKPTKKLDEEFLKEAAENGRMSVGGMHREDTGNPAFFDAKIVMLSNQELNVTSTGDSMRERARVVPFNQRFLDGTLDPALPQELRREAPGIMRMILNDLRKLIAYRAQVDEKTGNIRWRYRPVPQAVKGRTRFWLMNQDSPSGCLEKMFLPAHEASLVWREHLKHQDTPGYTPDPRTPINFTSTDDIPLIKLGKGGDYGSTGLRAVAKVVLDEEGGDTKSNDTASVARSLISYLNTPAEGRGGKLFRLVPTYALVDYLAQAQNDPKVSEQTFRGLFGVAKDGWNFYKEGYSAAWRLGASGRDDTPPTPTAPGKESPEEVQQAFVNSRNEEDIPW